jgi:hypothetical protein
MRHNDDKSIATGHGLLDQIEPGQHLWPLAVDRPFNEKNVLEYI